MDLNMIQARQPKLKKQNNNRLRVFMPLNLTLGLNKLLSNPKPVVALFKISLRMLHMTAGTTQRTSSPQPLPCKAEAKKTHLEIFINSLESGVVVGVI